MTIKENQEKSDFDTKGIYCHTVHIRPCCAHAAAGRAATDSAEKAAVAALTGDVGRQLQSLRLRARALSGFLLSPIHPPSEALDF